MSDDKLDVFYYFPSPVYAVRCPQFLDVVKEVSDEYLSNNKADMSEIYPVKMTGNFYSDPRLVDFSSYIGESAWSILLEQGYNVNNFATTFTEMWTQEHHKHSLMEQHVHGLGSQIIGFYFLETPEGCSRLIFHDPKSAKVQIGLPETNSNDITIASNTINFNPEPGLLVFTNSWLPHSFGRHASDDPIRFVHFNMNVQYVPPVPSLTPECTPQAEII